jgi:hypothetical protein
MSLGCRPKRQASNSARRAGGAPVRRPDLRLPQRRHEPGEPIAGTSRLPGTIAPAQPRG